MGRLTIDSIADGMVLKTDVHDRSGRLLLACDTELNAKHIRMFLTWGVTEADIVGIDDQVGSTSPVADVDPACLAVAENELRSLFRNTDFSHPAISELFRLCTLRKVRNAPH